MIIKEIITLIKRISLGVYLRTGIVRKLNTMRTRKTKNGVFIWIPKTAGTSVFEVLAAYNCLKLKDLKSARFMFPQQGLVTFGHMSYALLLEKKVVSPEFHEKAFKFCFVRNPFSRVVSLYEYLKKTGRIHSQTGFRSFCGYSLHLSAKFSSGFTGLGTQETPYLFCI